MAAIVVPSPYKGLQESVSSVYRSMAQKVLSMRSRKMLAPLDQHACQQAQNLKWQQEMFHRILQLTGLVQEGLSTEEELSCFRQDLLQSVTAMHEDGEWPDFTRNKLIFLQDLFHSGCIGEVDYHKSKMIMLVRLAEQNADICTQDFEFLVASPSRTQKRMPTAAVDDRIGERGEQVGDFSPCKNVGPSPKKSPLKQMTSRLKKGLSFKDAGASPKQKLRVPHALDFLRPEGCPKRHPPVPILKSADGPADSPLFHSSDSAPSMESSSQAAETTNAPGTPASRLVNASPSAMTPEKPSISASYKSSARSPGGVGTLVSGLMRKVKGDIDKQPLDTADRSKGQEQRGEQEVAAVPRRLWRLDLLRPPRKLLGALGGLETEKGAEGQEDEDEENRPLDDKIYKNPPNGEGPDTVNIKQKIHKHGAPTDFFIDKVLGDNIKNELARIRSELHQTNPGQTFTNDQIDAIATRLPVDKTELMRFFPTYGEIVLEVVHKEFKDHVAEMETSRKAGSMKRTKSSKEPKTEEMSRSSPLVETDKENRQASNLRSPKVSLNKVIATTEGSPRGSKKSGLEQLSNSTPRRARSQHSGMALEEDLDGKLIAEIQKLPVRRQVDSRPIRI